MQPQPAAPPMPVPAKPRRRWWLRGVLLMLALVLVVPAGFFGYTTYATRHDLADAEAEADRTDPNWRLRALIDEEAPLDSKDNSALLVIKAASKAKNYVVGGAANYDEIFALLPANTRLNGCPLDPHTE